MTADRGAGGGAALPALSRRRAAAGLAALAGWGRVRAAAPAAPAAVEIGAGVFMLPGLGGEPAPANLGRVGNAGFIVGPEGVLAVDTGVSRRHGEMLLAAVAHVTPRPVRLALVTQARQAFLFGAGAYQARGIPVHMHRAAAGLMAARCERCLQQLRQTLGDDEMQGTAVFKPDQLFDGAQTIETIGRPVDVLDLGHASGLGDVCLFDRGTRTLFAGGLLDHRRVPDIQDARLPAWHAALATLRTQGADHIVPGHGPVARPGLIDDVDAYLRHLAERVAALLERGVALSEVPDAAALPAYAAWDQYDTVHRRNAAILFLRLEHQALLGPPPAGVVR